MEFYVLLYFGILHVSDRVGRVPLSLFQMSRPHVVNPVYEIDLHGNRRQTVEKNPVLYLHTTQES